jgi:hypothetical protein
MKPRKAGKSILGVASGVVLGNEGAGAQRQSLLGEAALGRRAGLQGASHANGAWRPVARKAALLGYRPTLAKADAD